MLGVVKEQLLKIVEDIDAGNSNAEEEELLNIAKALKKYTRQDAPISKYQAYTYLRISRATFDNLVRAGKLPEGKHITGFKEKFWYKKDLNKYLKEKNI